ncbi:MAG: hypothetical protein L0Z50_23670 [Verrucomicrobiales bacterium]|nr:hypothetical protein [Verrucomicrobiales bacterium]
MKDLNVCERCIHFRRPRPQSEFISRLLKPSDTATSAVLQEILRDELARREGEIIMKVTADLGDSYYWPAKPLLSPYCAEEEADGKYRIYEIYRSKNPICRGWQEARGTARTCAACKFQVKNARPFERTPFTNLIEMAAVFGAPDVLSGPYKAKIDNAKAAKADEIKLAHDYGGVLPKKPDYLDHCGHFSNKLSTKGVGADAGYVVCSYQNPDEKCPAWKRKDPNE